MTVTQGNMVNPKGLADHLMRTDTNEKAEVLEISGFASDDVAGAMEEINATAAGTRTKSAAYHAKINPEPDERLTPEQAKRAADILASELKDKKGRSFEGQPRVIVEHIKDGRQHFHVVFSRIDVDRMKAIDPQNNYAAHMRTSRQIEKEMGLKVCLEKSDARPPDSWEMQKAERTGGPDPRVINREVLDLYNSAKTGTEFRGVLERKAWRLANGRDGDTYRVVYGPNEDDSVDLRRTLYKATKNEKIRLHEIETKFSDLDRKRLPSEREACEQIARQLKREGREVQINYKTARPALWEEYQQRRADKSKEAWGNLGKKNKARFDAIRKAYVTKNAVIESAPVSWAEKREARALLRGWVVDAEMKADVEAKTESRVLQKSLQEKAQGPDSYVEFLKEKIRERGDLADVALTELRRREALDAKLELDGSGLTVTGADVWRPEAPRYSPFEQEPEIEYVVKGGDVVHRRGGRDLLADRRDRVDVLQTDNDTIERGLRVAQRKFYGQALTVYGDENFQEKVARVAAEAGLKVEFANARLSKIMEDRKVELVGETAVKLSSARGEVPKRELQKARQDFEDLASVRATRAGGWKDRWAAASPEMQQAVDAYNLIPYADQAKRQQFVEAIAPQKMIDWAGQYREQLRGIQHGR